MASATIVDMAAGDGALARRLKVAAVALSAARVHEKALACSPENRPASRAGCLAFIRRFQTRFHAYVLEPSEVLEALLRAGLPRCEPLLLRIRQRMREVGVEGPKGARIVLAEWPLEERRILNQARRFESQRASIVAALRWLFSQAFVGVGAPPEAVLEALLHAGCLQAGGEEGGRWRVRPDQKPPALADSERRLFEPREPSRELLRTFALESSINCMFAWRAEGQCLEAGGGSCGEAAVGVPLGELGPEVLGERPELAQALSDQGVERLTAAQCRTLEALLGGRAVLLNASPGSGKTLALGMAALQRALAKVPPQPMGPTCPAGHSTSALGVEEAVLPCSVCGIVARGCRNCGCSREFDDMGDRICWCDRCCKSGCELVDSVEFLHCRECHWHSCKSCGEEAKRRSRPPEVLILVPTRELAIQIHRQIAALAKPLGLHCHAVVGGRSVGADIRALRRGQDMVVGNIGRVLDLVNKRHLRVDDLGLLLLDEADAMLEGHRLDSLYDVCRCLPPSVQVGCFASVVPPDAMERFPGFMQQPVLISEDGTESLLATECLAGKDTQRRREYGTMPAHLRHLCVVGKGDAKVRLLASMRRLFKGRSCLVFCGSRRTTENVTQTLESAHRGFGDIQVLHADLDQKGRELVMREFRRGKVRTVLCTQELMLGIDVPRVSVVINYDLPKTPSEFLIRAGRCGRQGRPGLTLSLLSKDQVQTMRAIVESYAAKLEEVGVGELGAFCRTLGTGGTADQRTPPTAWGATAAPRCPSEPAMDEVALKGCCPCSVCGCASERDPWGDRVCWCDSCWFQGCRAA